MNRILKILKFGDMGSAYIGVQSAHNILGNILDSMALPHQFGPILWYCHAN
jgi:hypothetical protein